MIVHRGCGAGAPRPGGLSCGGSHRVDEALGILETTGLTPALAALDAMEKAANVRVWQAELNDFLGVCIKLLGSTDSIDQALAMGRQVAESLHGRPVVWATHRIDPAAVPALHSEQLFNPLIQQDVVFEPLGDLAVSQEPFALGFIETQGFTAVFAAIDRACKAANVEVVAKEKLGGGYITVVVRGDVAAVKAAVEAGAAQVEGLGKLIASYVIPRPSSAVMGLLPKS